jgi:hypothetical protein
MVAPRKYEDGSLQVMSSLLGVVTKITMGKYQPRQLPEMERQSNSICILFPQLLRKDTIISDMHLFGVFRLEQIVKKERRATNL